MKKFVKKNFNALKGQITIPSDKSISHRAVILSSLANGKSVIKNFSDAEDPASTLNIFKNLGINIEKKSNNLIINSKGKLKPYSGLLNAGNSGTTMRLLSGILSGQNFNSTIVGDESLSNRPMKRIIEPLSMMGANIESNNFKAPLKIYGSELHGINYTSAISSAQVKSCILLAGLNTKDNSVTTFTEPFTSRNHTEIMLKHMGANIEINGTSISIKNSKLEPLNIEICADISSAAYFIAAAILVPNSKIILKNVGLNPTRTGILDVVNKMGANVKILDKREVCSEPVGDILVEYSENLKGCDICADAIPKLIDEIPIIAVIATQAQGKTVIKDAQDLRNKESDRISSVVNELKKLGADITETADGMIINGKTILKGDCEVDSYKDHRLAMSLYVAGLITKSEIVINGFEWVNISFPTFEKLFENIMV